MVKKEIAFNQKRSRVERKNKMPYKIIRTEQVIHFFDFR